MIIRWTYAFADLPAGRLPEARAFWTACTGTRASQPRGERHEFMTLRPEGAAGTDACVKRQGVTEVDGGAHLDLCTGDVRKLIGAAPEAGARLVADHGEWAGLTGWERLKGSRPEFEVLRPPTGLPVRILLQRLDDERPASAHLDLACADMAAVRARPEEHGTARVSEGPRWTVMRDPAGGVYCLTGRDPETGGLPHAGR
ncbi:VOC family protein [Streptomyces puniciscabiei]